MGTKITDLTALATAPDTLDVVAIVDVSDTTQAPSGTTKHITVADLGFLSSGDNISELVNNSGYITSSDFSNGGEAATANRDLGNTDAFALSFITNGVGRINIESGGNVGIGLTGATAKLHVSGTTRFNGEMTHLGGDIIMDGAGAGSLIINKSAPTFVPQMIEVATTSSTVGSPAIDGSSMFLSADATSATNNIYLGQNYRGSSGGLANYGVNITNHVSKLADFYWRSGAGLGTEKMRLTSDGNLGIGTVTPTEKLEVTGNILADGAFISTQGGLSSTLTQDVGNTIDPVLDIQGAVDTKYGININTVSSSVTTASGAGLQVRSEFNASTTDGFGIDTRTTTAGGNTSSKAIFAQAGNAVSNSFAGEFEVLTGSTSVQNMGLRVTNTNTSGTFDFCIYAKSSVIGTANAGTAITVPVNSGGVAIGRNFAAAELHINGRGTGTNKAFIVADSADSYKFIVQDNGDVGIGTATPTEKLDVVGSGIFSNTLEVKLSGADTIKVGGNAGGVRLGPNIGSASGGNQIYGRTGGSYPGLVLSTFNGTIWLKTDNVIGSTGADINFSGGNIEEIGSIESDLASLTLKVKTNDIADRLLVQTRDAAHTSYLDRFSIKGGSATPDAYFENIAGLGIGTTTPTEKLDVVGNAKVSLQFAVGSNIAGTSTVILKPTASHTRCLNVNATTLPANGTGQIITSISPSGTNIGLESNSSTTAGSQSTGVKGGAVGTNGTVHYGVIGTAQNASTAQAGVRGEVLTGGSVAPSGTNAAVMAVNNASQGTNLYGVFSESTPTTAASTVYGVWSKANNQGTGTTNAYGGYFEALNATNNYALVVPSGGGNVGLGTITPDTNALLDVDGVIKTKSYTVAGVPTAVVGGIIYVSDETGGATLAFSDGTNWRRTTDLAIVS